MNAADPKALLPLLRESPALFARAGIPIGRRGVRSRLGPGSWLRERVDVGGTLAADAQAARQRYLSRRETRMPDSKPGDPSS